MFQEKTLGQIKDTTKDYPIVDGPFGTQLHAEEYTDDGVPVVRISNLSFDGRFLSDDLVFISEKKASLLSRSKITKGDLIVAKTGATIGKAALFPYNYGIVASSCLKASFDPAQADQTFMLYLIMSSEGQRKVIDGASGSTRTTINIKPFENITFKIPPLPEQQKITEVLSTVDRAIAQTEALFAKHQRIKTGLMKDMLTRGIDEHGQLRDSSTYKFKPSIFGLIPTDWSVCLLDEVAKRGSGHTPNKSRPEYWNGQIKWVSLADSDKLDQIYISNTDKNISELGIQNSSAVKHPAGTVVISRDAGLGKSAIITETMAVSQHFIAWTCGKRLDNHFLYYWLQFKKADFEAAGFGTTIKTIGLLFFKKLKMVIPEIEEQKRIRDILLKADSFLSQLNDELNKLNRIKTGLMQDLLSGKVSVTPLLEK